MRCKQTAVLVALSVIAISTVGCRRSEQYAEPPPNTYSVAQFTLSTDSVADTVTGASVLPDFFPATKGRPLLGRSFAPGDYESVAQPVVVISDELWKRRFNTEPTIIGKRVRLNGRDVTVVGVAPPGFAWPKGALVWVPYRGGSDRLRGRRIPTA
jgi:MacB-like periplasmic core domain